MLNKLLLFRTYFKDEMPPILFKWSLNVKKMENEGL